MTVPCGTPEAFIQKRIPPFSILLPKLNMMAGAIAAFLVKNSKKTGWSLVPNDLKGLGYLTSGHK